VLVRYRAIAPYSKRGFCLINAVSFASPLNGRTVGIPETESIVSTFFEKSNRPLNDRRRQLRGGGGGGRLVRVLSDGVHVLAILAFGRLQLQAHLLADHRAQESEAFVNDVTGAQQGTPG
jgi:hypothetical protein